MNKANIDGVNLEPRVAKLETGLEILTRDVTSLAQVVREQSHNIESELQKLAIAVTQAAAPRKTEWPVLLAALMLIMAIGSAAFSPLQQNVANNKADIIAVQSTLNSHVMQDYHAVAGVKLQQVEARLSKLESNNEDRNKADAEELRLFRVGKKVER